jgi:hypothetical protein
MIEHRVRRNNIERKGIRWLKIKEKIKARIRKRRRKIKRKTSSELISMIFNFTYKRPQGK